MADMIVAYRVMPTDGEVEYSELEALVKSKVEGYKDDVTIKEIKSEPVGFGLQAVAVEFQMDENHGSEELENSLADEELVGEVTVTKMDRL